MKGYFVLLREWLLHEWLFRFAHERLLCDGLSPSPAGRNLINLMPCFEPRFSVVFRNILPPFLPLVPCSVIESYECGGTPFKDKA